MPTSSKSTKILDESEYVKYVSNFFKQNNSVKEYQCHTSKVHSVDWNVDGRKLASGKQKMITKMITK